MTNTLGGINAAIIAQVAVDNFKYAIAPLNAFTTDFSEEAKNPSESITTRIITKLAGYDFTGNYTDNANVVTVEKTVTLNKHIVQAVHLSDVEAGKSGVRDLLDKLIPEAAYAVGKRAFDYVMLQVKKATYTESEIVSTAANWDGDDVADLRTKVSKLAWGIDRSLVLEPDYIGALLKDEAKIINPESNSGNIRPLRDGALTRLFGFDVFEVTDIVPSTSPQEYIVGFAATPAAGAVAARPVNPQIVNNAILDYAVATDEKTGLSIGVRIFYDVTTGKKYAVVETLIGFVSAQASGLVRIVSEATS